MPAGPCRRPIPSAASTAKRANSSSAYHRSGTGARDHRPVRGAGVRELGAAPRADSQRLNVPCSPTGASPMPTASRSPGCAAQVGGHRRHRPPERAGPGTAAAGPGSPPPPARPSAAAGRGGRTARCPDHAPARGQRPQLDPPGLLGQPAPPGRDRGPLERPRRGAVGPAGQQPPAPRVGVAAGNEPPSPVPSSFANRTPGRPPHRPPVDRHPRHRRGHGAPRHPPQVQRDQLRPGLPHERERRWNRRGPLSRPRPACRR